MIQGPDATADIPASEAEITDGAALVTRHIRGSSLMLVGRVMAMSVGFLTQVIVVRHLLKSDYGAFAYALSAALLLQSVLALGADRADTRFLALYEHQRDHARLLGVIVFEAATILALGTAAVATVWAFRTPLLGSSAGASAGTGVFVVLIALAPIQALDWMVINVFAAFASPWSVFFRRYLLSRARFSSPSRSPSPARASPFSPSDTSPPGLQASRSTSCCSSDSSAGAGSFRGSRCPTSSFRRARCSRSACRCCSRTWSPSPARSWR